MFRLAIKPCRPVHRWLGAPIRWHSTATVENSVSNNNQRLRLMEEKYTCDLSSPFPAAIDSVLTKVAETTEKEFRNAHMMVSQCQAKLLHQLTLLLRPRRVLEIGTFTGYSTIAMASALESAATITTLELDQRPLQIAHQYIQKAGLNDIVEMKQGPAIESLIQLTRERPNLQYDMIFLDADKGGYIQYYEHIMQHNLLSDRGCLLADNVLFFGQVHREAGYIDPQPVEASKNIKKTARKAHAFNAHVYSDPRAQVVVLPLFDGLSIIQKRKKD